MVFIQAETLYAVTELERGLPADIEPPVPSKCKAGNCDGVIDIDELTTFPLSRKVTVPLASPGITALKVTNWPTVAVSADEVSTSGTTLMLAVSLLLPKKSSSPA